MTLEEREEYLRREGELMDINRRRSALLVFLGCLVFVAYLILSHPWDWLLGGLVGLWVVSGLATMLWPGRCYICTARTGFSGPPPGTRPRDWWDLRPYPRSSMVFVCPEHAHLYLLASIRTREES